MNVPTTFSYQHTEYSFEVECRFRLAKINEDIENCQDYYDSDPNGSRLAIADGATQSFYSGLWARILCGTYCLWPDTISPQNWVKWHESAQASWGKEVNNKLKILKATGKPSWIECQNGLNLKKDAFSTFVGMSLSNGYIRGICIGDSYAMLVRLTTSTQEQDAQTRSVSIIRLFPGTWQHLFGSRTTGLSSYKQDHPHMPEFFDIPIPDDSKSYRILLMTDALAEYTLKMESKGATFISKLLSLASESQFIECISECRKNGLANDDISLIVTRISSRCGVSHQPSTPSELTIGELEKRSCMSDRTATANKLAAPRGSSQELLPALPSSSDSTSIVASNDTAHPQSAGDPADQQLYSDSSSVVNDKLSTVNGNLPKLSSQVISEEPYQSTASGSDAGILSKISFEIKKKIETMISIFSLS